MIGTVMRFSPLYEKDGALLTALRTIKLYWHLHLPNAGCLTVRWWSQRPLALRERGPNADIVAGHEIAVYRIYKGEPRAKMRLLARPENRTGPEALTFNNAS